MSVFDSAVLSFSTAKDASTAASTKAAAIAAAREDLSKDLQHAHSTMMVQLQARVAIYQARQAVAEKQRLQQERRREKQVEQAKEAAIAKYRASMRWLMSDLEEEFTATSGFDGMSRLTNAHKVRTQPELH
jgi:translation initiation factor IF-2